MMAFGKLEAGGESVYVPGAVYYAGDLKDGASGSGPGSMFEKVKKSLRSIGQIFNQVIVICKFVEVLDPKLTKVTDEILNTPSNLDTLRTNLQGLVSSFDDPGDPNDLASQIVDAVTAVFGNIPSAMPLTNFLIECVNKVKPFPLFPPLLPGIDDPPLEDSAKQDFYFGNNYLGDAGINQIFNKLKDFLDEIKALNQEDEALGVIIPNGPWTPIIKDISVDYKAKAK